MERIVSKPSNEKYRKRYDKVFKKRKNKKKFNVCVNNDPNFGG